MRMFGLTLALLLCVLAASNTELSAQRERFDDREIWLEKIPLKLKRLNGSIEEFGYQTWSCGGSWITIHNMTRAGNNLDVIWGCGAILMMKRPGLVEEKIVDTRLWVEDVVWDGLHIWIATRFSGIWVLNVDGENLRRFDTEIGLRPGDNRVLLHAVAPGRVIAAGSYGPNRHGWCAQIEWSEQEWNKNTIKLFHDATLTQADLEEKNKSNTDSHAAYIPQWVHALQARSKEEPPLLLVGRRTSSWEGTRHPLVINLRTLQVSVYETELHNADNYTRDSYFSRNGELLECYDFHVMHYALPGQSLDRDGWKKLCIEPYGGLDRKLLLYKGSLNVPGETWWRIDPATMTSRRLGGLPNVKDASLSAHYGLVVRDANTGSLLRVRGIGIN